MNGDGVGQGKKQIHASRDRGEEPARCVLRKRRASGLSGTKRKRGEIGGKTAGADLRYEGRTVVCAASGPSLNAADLAYCRERGWPVWATNSSYKLGCDGLYACDKRWWDANPEASGATAECWTQDSDAAAKYGLNFILSVNQPGFSENPRWIHQGRNSGYQLLNLIYLFGAARILLLGYDMGFSKHKHWHPDHGRGLPNPTAGLLEDCARRFDTIQPLKCEVLNCTPGSAVTRFPKVALREVL